MRQGVSRRPVGFAPVPFYLSDDLGLRRDLRAADFFMVLGCVCELEIYLVEFLEGLAGVVLLTAVDSRTNPASTAGTAQHDLDLVSG